MTDTLLRTIAREDLHAARRDPVDDETLEAARSIVDDVRRRGWAAVEEYAARFGDLQAGDPAVLDRAALDDALDRTPGDDRALLERVAGRIERFAVAQRGALRELTLTIPGGRAAHRVAPVASAGCYAPGGRFPLPSSVLMTAVTARAAGVEQVWVASPRPAPITLAAAAIAGVDGLLAVGGAQAIAALAFGAGPVPACDVVVGPGNRHVTAAKQLVAGRVGIDMLAGPSELLVMADDTADPTRVAADLLAQAEHDPDALPVLVSLASGLAAAVRAQLAVQLHALSTAAVARRSLALGFTVEVADVETAVAVCDDLAPEHVALHLADPAAVADRLQHFGAVFIGEDAAEVLGDYGAGPNHTLPTGGAARRSGGLSVLHFLRTRTSLTIDDAAEARSLTEDAVRLAELEGLAGHAASARLRLG
jgi:phosphoribosyl-ATP pyrophosphohydrolase/phosphoribosyl-AMP cyclohydrolase/histidinol dehydrogenase